MDEEASNRFDRLDDTCGKLFDLLRTHSDQFNQHRVDTSVLRASLEQRVALLESTSERRSALRSGLTMAGIGAFFGALAAAVGKKTGLWTLALAALLCGCGTPESVKETNYLNGEAARWIVEASPDPAIDRAATTIAAGSAQIERKLGEPEAKPIYTPETHEKTVAQAKQDIDDQEAVKKGITGWIEGMVTKLADFILPGVGGILVGAWAWLRKNAQYDKLKKSAGIVVETINKLPDGMSKTVKGAVETAAAKVGAGDLVKASVKMLEK